MRALLIALLSCGLSLGLWGCAKPEGEKPAEPKPDEGKGEATPEKTPEVAPDTEKKGDAEAPKAPEDEKAPEKPAEESEE